MGPTDAGHQLTDEQIAQRLDDARLVEALRAGDGDAFGLLYDRWFDRIYDLERRIVHDPDVAADLTQDTFLRALRSIDSLRDTGAFGGWLLRIGRNAALEHARRAGRTVVSDAAALAMIEQRGPSAADAPVGFRVEDSVAMATDPSVVAERSEIAELLESAVDALNERDSEVLDLQLRHGLTPTEIGEVLGINRNSANQLVHRLRTRLDLAIRARVLWRGGDPWCAELAVVLAERDVSEFGPAAVSVITAHAESCDGCGERQRLWLAPAVLFSAVPIAVAPSLVKARVAHALAAEGVPMGGSAAAGGRAGRVRGRGVRRTLVPAAAAIAVIAAIAGLVALDASQSDNVGQPSTGTSADRDPGGGTSPNTTTTTTPDESPTPRVAASSTTPGTETGAVAVAPGGGAVSPPPVILPDGSGTTVPVAPTTTPTSPPTTTPTSPPTTTPPTTTPPPVEPPIVSVNLSISTGARVWLPGTLLTPVLSWNVAGAARVTVIGPGVAETAASGSVEVCPSGWDLKGCAPPPGNYVFTVLAFDASGDVAVARSVILTVLD